MSTMAVIVDECQKSDSAWLVNKMVKNHISLAFILNLMFLFHKINKIFI